MGNIAKYDEWLKPENLMRVKGWAMDGLSAEQIAINMGIAKSTYHDWRKKFPKFADAVKIGKDAADREVENALFKNSTGYWITEEKTFIEVVGGKEKRKVERTKKWVPPNVGAQVYWLKNRKPDTWNERTNVQDLKQEDKISDLMDAIVGGLNELE